MDFEEVVKNRHSIRKFLDKQVEEEKITKILELANLSPSARNCQARKIIIIKDRKIIEDISLNGAGQEWIKDAPLIIAVCADSNESNELHAVEDAVIFSSYLQLSAVSVGLSSCWVGGFDEIQTKKILSLPDDLKPVALFPIGYSAENPEIKSRKNLDEIIFKEL